MEQGFIPLTSQLGIPGTSFRLQLGLINGKWASRLLKGNNVIDSYVYKDIEGDFPNQNLIVGWVLRTVAIPNMNPHQIMKTTQALVKQAIQKKEEKKVMVPVSETKEIELEKVPETELRRVKASGWVREEGMKPIQELEEERRQAFKERMIARKEQEQVHSTSTLKVSRDLPSIPSSQSEIKDTSDKDLSKFCPYCGKDLNWKFCPYCGKPLPHEG